ncbi:glycosyltransferase [Peptostreptococcaceae bacterium AGR-M142]
MKTVDLLFLYSIISIWIMLIYQLILAFGGYAFYRKLYAKQESIDKGIEEFQNWPTVSLLIPAHNEEKVIEKTVRSILSMDYPKDKLEVIVINDNSSDKTGEILKKVQDSVEGNLKIITTTKENGGKGKSNALNIGFEESKGEIIGIYDADNTPNVKALKYLTYQIQTNEKYGAVIGKFRTRNKKRNPLTKFINIETLSFQWLSQGGRYFIFGFATIPGTNFVIRRSMIDKLGGWDIKAITEDTEVSIRIYLLGYEIGFMPLSITYEQEPETVRVWFKQRLRWVKGNLYVIHKYLFKVIRMKSYRIALDIFYFFSTYFIFLTSVLISDAIFLLGLIGNYFGSDMFNITVPGNFLVVWLLAYTLFILEISIVLYFEKGEGTFRNFVYTVLMYFTYCQLWIVLAVHAFISYIGDLIYKKEFKWVKTERF